MVVKYYRQLAMDQPGGEDYVLTVRALICIGWVVASRQGRRQAAGAGVVNYLMNSG